MRGSGRRWILALVRVDPRLKVKGTSVPQRRLDQLSDDALFADWSDTARRAYDDAVQLHWNRRMFRNLAAVFRANPRLREVGGHFWEWARHNYIAGAGMAIRRELDRDGSVANLRRILHEIISRPTVLSRARYLARWNPESEGARLLANRGFESFGFVRPSSDPAEDHIDPADVAADLERLRVQTDAVQSFIERTIAHRQRSEPEPVTFDDFNETIAVVETVFKKYYARITQTTVAQLEPVPQYDTIEVFTFPWLPPGIRLEVIDD
jgi:hypothetical protein